MCEAKPGLRCADDTCATSVQANAAYRARFSDGPAVDPITSARSQWDAPPVAPAVTHTRAVQRPRLRLITSAGPVAPSAIPAPHLRAVRDASYRPLFAAQAAVTDAQRIGDTAGVERARGHLALVHASYQDSWADAAGLVAA